MTRSIQKLFFAIVLFIPLLTGGRERVTVHSPAIAAQPARPAAETKLPAGVARSDWQGILVAHEEWKHTIREAPDGAQGWQAENTGSGLRATFDGHGGVVRPAGGDWHWGLELEGYGIGAERRLVAARTPRVGTNGRRIGYDWDGNLEEWYQNRAAGLEHCYTIRERLGRPGEEAPLELWLKVRGELAAVAVDDDGRGASFGRERGQALLRYAGLKVWDAEGREVAARLGTEGSGELRLVVEEQTASYPLTIDPTITAQQAYLKASNTEVQDFFGYSVTISGETVVVGAPYESSNAIGVNGDQLNNLASYSGAAYVFVRNGLTWTQQAYLKASNTQSREDCFGWSVGISGETIVVGAPQESRNISGVNGNVQGNTPLWASSSGAAYIFVRNGSNWIQQAYLKASNTRAGDKFGTSVAISGETVVVGSPYEDSDATGVNGNQLGTSASDSGAAYVFFRNGAIWSQQAYLKASNTEANDWFGYSVATSGKTVLVGAWAEDSYAKGIDGDQSDNSASDSGAAYIFVRDDINWNQQAYLKASNAEPWNRFGWSVALSGERVVIGAHGESNAVTGVNGDQSGNASRLAQWSGAAYVFLRNGTMWTQEAYLKASNTSVSASFGFSVAISGERLVVGSHLQSSLAWVSGAAYVFVHNGTSWFEQAFIKASNPDSQDYFGRAVAVSGDTVLVGAAEDDSNATGINGDQFDNSAENSGAAYVFQAKALSIANQPIAGVSGGVLLTQPVIVIRDWTGQISTSEIPPVTVAIKSGEGGTLGGGTTTVDAINGVASFNNLTLSGIVGIDYVLSFSSPQLALVTSNNIRVTAGPASQMAIIAGNNQTAAVATAVSVPPSVVVRDAQGNPVAGIQVTFAIASGGGSLTGGSVTTNSSGIATVGSWTLGTVAGGNTLTASIVGLSGSPVTFTATGTVGAATQIAINVGNNQTATVGTAVPIAPSVLVRDVHQNPVPGVPVTFAIASGGGIVTGASATTNASGIATVGSWTLGTVAGVNTLTASIAGLSGSPVTFTAVGTPVTVPGVPTVGTQAGGEIGPGSTVTITQTLANSTATPTASTYQATLPNGLFALSCTAPFGTCTIGAGSLIGSGEGELQRVAATTALASNRTVAWAGTIPGGGSVAITYQVQVGVQASNGVQQCVTSTISGLPGPQTCLAVSIPPSGPGNLPIAAGLPNSQKPGSVLIFNIYTSSVSQSQSDSQISLTNTNPVNAAYVHLFFVDGSSCTVADQVVTLTQNQTISFLASDFDPGATGYLMAVAVDRNGCPVIGNYLVGGSVVRFESGHHANLPAIGISGLVQSPPLCNPNSTTATLAFNGVAYDELPRTLTVYTLPSLANGNNPLLIVNRIGGDLASGAETIGVLAGLLFDDSEAARSFSINGGTCQVRGLLGNNFPRTVPRYTTVIPAGRTGWMKFWAAGDEAISGVLINEAISGLSGGYNLPVLTTTSTATLTIPVIPN